MNVWMRNAAIYSSWKFFSVYCDAETLTWIGNAVSVPRHIVIQSEQQHPHGQREHTSQEAVENQVEEQDEGWIESKECTKQKKKRDMYMRHSI